VGSGWDLYELRPAARSLEEIFLQLTGGEVSGGAANTTPNEPQA
jgi:hypothetical protein